MARLYGAVLVACVVGATAACSAETGPVLAQSRAQLADCQVPGLNGPAKCGTHVVWEDRNAKRGRQITLHFVVVPARGPAKQPEPVFYLDGGPGGSAVDVAGPLTALLAAVNESRDLVFLDSRGTGRSNALRCAAQPPDAPLQRFFSDFLADDYVRECLAVQQADVRFYTHSDAMDDLDEVRRVLGYERMNLYGASGGTRAAQIYVRKYPRRVRAVVLHGVHPMDGEMPLAYSRAMEIAVRELFEACRMDSGCHERYPDLAAQWERVKARFAAGHVDTDIIHQPTGRKDRVRITRGVFAEGMRHLLYDLRSASQLPPVIAAAARGDFSPFAEHHIARSQRLANAISMGMFMSATCAEDVRFISEDDVQKETAGTFLGDYRVRRQQAACRIWPHADDTGADFQQPVRSAAPALLISGDADVATPVAGAERVARGFANGRHVVFPNQGHNLANPPCAARIIADFLAAGTPSRLDTACVQDTRRPPFGT